MWKRRDVERKGRGEDGWSVTVSRCSVALVQVRVGDVGECRSSVPPLHSENGETGCRCHERQSVADIIVRTRR